ncbi:MAG: hypothetical protein WC428_06365 [Candidatus Paceibacterota bacterium]|jgi:hypothetical protein
MKKRHYHWGRKLSEKENGRVVNTPTPCSCWMCGNPRKYFYKITIQERKQKEKDRVEYDSD